MLISSSLCTDLVTVLVTFSVILIGYYKWAFQYWKRKNLPYLEPRIPFGNIGSIFNRKKHISVILKDLYDKMKKRGWKHGGIYALSSPVYLVLDLDYLKNILTKDFQYFTDRGLYYNEKADPLSAHLLHINGVKWRNLRTKLTPTFTSSKMKMMFQTLVDCEENLQKKIQIEYEKKTPVDIKEVLGCFTTDIIGSCAFGLDCKTFEEDNSAFRVSGRRIFDLPKLLQVKFSFANFYPDLSHFLNISLIPKDLTNFFTKIVEDTVNYREKNQVNRKDFIQLLIDLKNNKLTEEEGYKHDGTTLTMEEIAAQSFVFFAAGFETSSTTMTFALYELAKNQDNQEKLRDETNTVLAKYDDKITYDAIQEMKYLDQVIDESLRKYPPGPLLLRKCVQDYKIPDTDIVLKKGTLVMIPILAIHRDEEYYPDPEKFDPERFCDENKQSRHRYAHIPFGEGPRNCIGMRFGLMQSKVGIASLLRNYKFTVNGKTKEPLVMKPNSWVVLAVEGEVWLDAHKL